MMERHPEFCESFKCDLSNRYALGTEGGPHCECILNDMVFGCLIFGSGQVFEVKTSITRNLTADEEFKLLLWKNKLGISND